MSYLGDFNRSLSTAVSVFIHNKWSVIPLRGDTDPSQPKAPALPRWKPYQRRLPAHYELQEWFDSSPKTSNQDHAIHSKNRVIGIVLGKISRLVVLDIDTSEMAESFQKALPHLTQTLTITSGNRRLPHYYFCIPADLYVSSITVEGGELRSDGQYVVAPGSCINGRVWEVVNDVEPLKLTERDLRRLLAFLQPPSRETTKKRAMRPSGMILDVSPDYSDAPKMTPLELIHRYRRLANKHGRNNALFSISCFARDRGLKKADVEHVLSDVHAHFPGTESESLSSRIREAARTVASAFSRPARRMKSNKRLTGQLPNSIREALLQRGLDYVARFLDGLLIAGFRSGHEFTVSQAYHAVSKFGIGRNTIIKALKAVIVTEQTTQNLSPHTPLSTDANAAKCFATEIKQCLFDRVANPNKNRGRPSTLFVMPLIEQLCTLLKVENKGGDLLRGDDLRSPALYRAALHTAMLKRSPGQYNRSWLAKRLGVSQDSCRRYEKQMHVDVQPMYLNRHVHWNNLDHIIPSDVVPGQFLEDESGRRYPVKTSVARMLLAQNRRVVMKCQQANHYSVKDRLSENMIQATNPILSKNAMGFTNTSNRVSWKKIDTSEVPVSLNSKNVVGRNNSSVATTATSLIPQSEFSGSKKCCGPQQSIPAHQNVVGRNNSSVATPPSSLIPKSEFSGSKKCCGPQQSTPAHQNVAGRNIYHDQPQQKSITSDDAEQIKYWEGKVYDMLRAMNAQQSLTRKCIQQLLSQYGVKQVERALKVMASRSNIQNPAGFLLVFLRSESRTYTHINPAIRNG